MQQLYNYTQEISFLANQKHVLVILASPERLEKQSILALAKNAYVIAVDGGANVCYDCGIEPDMFCGDQDSLSETTRVWLEDKPCEREIYSTYKDDTDFSLALRIIAEKEGLRTLPVVATCAFGGRADHMLGVVGTAKKYAHELSIYFFDNTSYACVFSQTHIHTAELTAQKNTSFSCLSLSDTTQISLDGAQWDLIKKDLAVLQDLGVSNKVEKPCVKICLHAGIMLLFVLRCV